MPVFDRARYAPPSTAPTQTRCLLAGFGSRTPYDPAESPGVPDSSVETEEASPFRSRWTSRRFSRPAAIAVALAIMCMVDTMTSMVFMASLLPGTGRGYRRTVDVRTALTADASG
jgi:hypothetical protein